MADQLSNDLAALRIDRDAPPSSGWGWRLLLGLLLGAAVVYAGWLYVIPYVESKIFKTEVEATQIVLISPAEADVRLSSTGYVVPQRVTQVGAKILGRIAKVHVREGDEVKEGQLLAELESADAEAALQSARSQVALARADVATAQAQLAEARLQAVRERKLVDRGVAGAATAEDLEARVDALRAQVEAAKAAVRAAQSEAEVLTVNLDFLKITAPMSGTVLGKPTAEGELVGQMAASLVELADFSTLLVETDVPEARLHLVEPGGPAEIQLDAFPGRRFRGRVRDISPKVDRAKATIMVKVEFVDSTEGVLPDMAARVSFLEQELRAEEMKEPAKAVVPANAVADRGGSKVVFVLDDGVVRMKPVTLGPPMGNGFELLEGPAAGTKVVRGPNDALVDGQPVKQKDAT